MKITQLIRELADVIEKHGNLEISYFDGACTHPLAVIVGLHRTGDSVWIWKHIEPWTAAQIQDILDGATTEELAHIRAQGFVEDRVIAAMLSMRGKGPR